MCPTFQRLWGTSGRHSDVVPSELESRKANHFHGGAAITDCSTCNFKHFQLVVPSINHLDEEFLLEAVLLDKCGEIRQQASQELHSSPLTHSQNQHDFAVGDVGALAALLAAHQGEVAHSPEEKIAFS